MFFSIRVGRGEIEALCDWRYVIRYGNVIVLLKKNKP